MHTFNHKNESSVSKVCSQRLSCLASLAGGVIHELHNGLGAASSNAKALQLTSSPENADHMTFMQGAIDRMQHMTQMLTLYTRDAVVDLQRVAVRPVLKEVIANLQATPEFQDVEFIWEPTPNRQHTGHTNADLLKKSFEALLRNACESLGTKKRTIKISLGEGSQEECQNGKALLGCPDPRTDYLRCRVEDTGCGIPAGNLPRIFDPFFTTKMRARGLGLAYVVGLVQQTNCVLTCQTKEQKGTVFTLCIPVA